MQSSTFTIVESERASSSRSVALILILSGDSSVRLAELTSHTTETSWVGAAGFITGTTSERSSLFIQPRAAFGPGKPMRRRGFGCGSRFWTNLRGRMDQVKETQSPRRQRFVQSILYFH